MWSLVSEVEAILSKCKKQSQVIQRSGGCPSWDLNRKRLKNGFYNDGHEREDVVAYRKEVFVRFCSQLNLDLWNVIRTCFQTQLSKF